MNTTKAHAKSLESPIHQFTQVTTMIPHFIIPFLLIAASILLFGAFADAVHLAVAVAKLQHVNRAPRRSVIGSIAHSFKAESKHRPVHSAMQAPMVQTRTD